MSHLLQVCNLEMCFAETLIVVLPVSLMGYHMYSRLHDMGIGRIWHWCNYFHNKWSWFSPHLLSCICWWLASRGSFPDVALEFFYIFLMLDLYHHNNGFLKELWTLSDLLCISYSQVTASAWLNDLRNQIEQTRILSTVYRSASAIGSRLPSIASAKAKVAGAGAVLRPVSNGTQVTLFIGQISFSLMTLIFLFYFFISFV